MDEIKFRVRGKVMNIEELNRDTDLVTESKPEDDEDTKKKKDTEEEGKESKDEQPE